MAALTVTSLILVTCSGGKPEARWVEPILDFPQSGMDDPVAYQGYATRFVRDTDGNTVQLSINRRLGRVVNIWADDANESISFTVRDSQGNLAAMEWESDGAEISADGPMRYVRYSLALGDDDLQISLFLLGSMRQERDYQHFKRNLAPFGGELFSERELHTLMGNFDHLSAQELASVLTLLRATGMAELRGRLLPRITHIHTESTAGFLVELTTFDGLYHLSLELTVEADRAEVALSAGVVSIAPLVSGPIVLTVKIGSDSPSLTPLRRDEIFNADFLRFYGQAKSEHESLPADYAQAADGSAQKEQWLRFLWLERQVLSVELLVSREKVMAGLPNFATYFGRDGIMSMLMFESIWSPKMLEQVVAAAVRKLSPTGKVSHEEALGGQAIRENAAQLNRLIPEYLLLKEQAGSGAESHFDEILSVLERFGVVRENYNMVDEDFQLSLAAARYLALADISDEEKRKFLLADGIRGGSDSRLALLLRNLSYISNLLQPYIADPVVENLVAFPRRDAKRWHAGSWRDSGAGYANGRYALDINAIWAPHALKSIGEIFASLRGLNFTLEELLSQAPEVNLPALHKYAVDSQAISADLSIWQEAVRHFEVSLSAAEVEAGGRRRLAQLPQHERAFWNSTSAAGAAQQEGMAILALALDETGQPIPVVSTDPAALWFLEDYTADILSGEKDMAELLAQVDAVTRPYPYGLFVDGLGPLVSNDAYASEAVWEAFRLDPYHSPRVVWGREVNLILLGLARQITGAYNEDGQLRDPILEQYVAQLRDALDKIYGAVEASGLKHNELWSYRIEGNRLAPSRYPTSSDIQLWNLTDLAVQYALGTLP
ncbi:MAG: hypothetical protein IID15_07630, partial [Candidatus Marinimicrobia bacterium]|nr:hypothetical protein [Candidatus Neomarinimicrobiota bacterium]